MKIKFETKETAGTSRGGSDLDLIVRMTSDVWPVPDYKEAFEEEWATLADPNYRGCEPWVEDGHLTCDPLPEYDIEMRLPKNEVEDIVKRAARGEWHHNMKTGEYWTRYQVFVAGNAD